MGSPSPALAGVGEIAREVARPRTFAIVSPSDAGKTTPTTRRASADGVAGLAAACSAVGLSRGEQTLRAAFTTPTAMECFARDHSESVLGVD